jgi:hypothetical protein
MRSLGDLLASPEGRAFLESRGVALDHGTFTERLRPPARAGLVELLALPPETTPVYVAHQTHVDFRRSVVSKLRAARELDGGSISAVMLWLDMDRIGSDKASTTITWPSVDGDGAVRLVPHRLRNLESRFVPVERERLEEVVAQLRAWSDGDAHGRVERLAGALLEEEPTTLARCTRTLASFLLREQLAFRPPWAFVSTLANHGLLTETLDDALDRIDDVVRVFNGAVEDLAAADVDPQVHPLADDYLPLNYACESCGARRRLRHERTAGDHFALLECSCGAVRRFHLGASELSLGELEETGRWSTDVTLPMYLNDLAGGVVAGRSSALYGLVLNEVLEQALGRSPIPMFVPGDLADVLADEPAVDSVLYDYLAGSD